MLLVFNPFLALTQVVNVPDSILRSALLSNANVNINGDNAITYVEASTYNGSLTFDGNDIGCISDFTGLESFVSLTGLIITNHSCLTDLDVSANVDLVDFFCHRNKLGLLDIGNKPSLFRISCHNNLLTSVNVSLCPSLERLDCSTNHIASIDVSHNPALRFLEVDHNRLDTVNVDLNFELKWLEIDDNQLSYVSVLHNPKLRYLFCHNNLITSLDVSSNSLLDSLACQNNLIRSLDLQNCPNLVRLYCHDNRLRTLDMRSGGNTNLTTENFRAFGNSELNCISVDNVQWSESNWPEGICVDSSANFDNSCITDVQSISNTENVSIYPNPTADILYILGVPPIPAIKLFNSIGQQQSNMALEDDLINLGGMSNGVYILKLEYPDGNSIRQKIIVQR